MFKIILVLLLAAMLFYYSHVVVHYLGRGVFGNLPLQKLIIPFYGWIQLLKQTN